MNYIQSLLLSKILSHTIKQAYYRIPEFCICYVGPLLAWHHYHLSMQLFPEMFKI